MAHLRYSVLYQGKIDGINEINKARCSVIVDDPNVGHLLSTRLALKLSEHVLVKLNQDCLVTRGSERIAYYVLRVATTLCRYRIMESML